MLVFDTSAYINGQRDHLPPATFPGVWSLVSDAMADGRVVAPRAVYTELLRQDDDVAAWARARTECFVEPSPTVQRRAGEIQAAFPDPGQHEGADAFVVAEAEIREFTVVTYEGRSFTGVPHRRWPRTMPGICQRFNVACRTLPEALKMLGARF